MDKKSIKKGRFIYSMVLLCTAAMIFTGYIITNTIKIKSELKKQEVQVAPPVVTDAPKKAENPAAKEKTAAPREAKAPEETSALQAETTSVEVESVAANSVSIENISLAMPTEGIITTQHSTDNLNYSVTFDDWRTHTGIDIDAEESAQVRAAQSGKISRIYTDEMMGIVIEIDHGGYTTVYANLSSDKLVKEGISVEKGDIISGIGKSAKAEALQNPHLHFEVLVDGVSQDPLKFIK